MGDFDGLVAVVTGGSSGIGAAVVARLAEDGARVFALDLVAPADPLPAGAAFVPADVTDRATVEAAIATVEAAAGALDILVNNAGIGATGDVAAQDDAGWQHVLDVNVVGMARAAAACLPLLRRSDHAAIVNTSSVVAFVGVPERAAYAASKGAVAALTLAMAADHVREGIRVNAVAPGTTDTPWVGRLLAAAEDPEAAAAALRARQPLGRLVTAEEVADAIAFLAGPRSGATTGTILQVDGGMANLRLPAPPS